MIRWLNSLNDLPASLVCLSFPEWQALYRKYLMGLGMYKPGTTNRMNGNQQPSITLRDSGYISLLRQASIMLAQPYDLRPAHEEENDFRTGYRTVRFHDFGTSPSCRGRPHHASAEYFEACGQNFPELAGAGGDKLKYLLLLMALIS